MALSYSTGTRNGVLGTDGLKAQFDGGFLDVYSGPPPASADLAPTGTKLGTYTKNGDGVTGLLFDAPSGGVLQKKTGENWQATGLAAGTAGYYRLRTATDTGAESTTDRRIQGLVARTGGDMNMSNTVFTVGSPHTLQSYQIAALAN